MSAPDPRTVTELLRKYSPADPESGERLFAAIYPELRRLARALMRRERPGHTLQPTELVHDVFLRLVDQTVIASSDRARFLGIAARAMRQVLVDHARRRDAIKRGRGVERVTFDEALGHGLADPTEIIALDEALSDFAAHDARAARVVELKVFGGLTSQEAADLLGVSKRTVDGDWALARLWIARHLASGRP